MAATNDQTKYLARQSVAGIVGGYNARPVAGTGGGALPGMKGPDLKPWQDMVRAAFSQPMPAGYGAITEPQLRAIQELQYYSGSHGLHPLKIRS